MVLRSETFTLQLYRSLQQKLSPEVENVSFQLLPNQVSKKSFHTFEDIYSRESHAKLYKKPNETLETD